MSIWESLEKKMKEAPTSNGSGSKAEAVISSSAVSQFDTSDFVQLAILCIDQAGVPANAQKEIEKLINRYVSGVK